MLMSVYNLSLKKKKNDPLRNSTKSFANTTSTDSPTFNLRQPKLDDLFGDDAFGADFDDPAMIFPTPRTGRQTARRVAAVAGVRSRGRRRRARAGAAVVESNDE